MCTIVFVGGLLKQPGHFRQDGASQRRRRRQPEHDVRRDYAWRQTCRGRRCSSSCSPAHRLQNESPRSPPPSHRARCAESPANARVNLCDDDALAGETRRKQRGDVGDAEIDGYASGRALAICAIADPSSESRLSYQRSVAASRIAGPASRGSFLNVLGSGISSSFKIAAVPTSARIAGSAEDGSSAAIASTCLNCCATRPPSASMAATSDPYGFDARISTLSLDPGPRASAVPRVQPTRARSASGVSTRHPPFLPWERLSSLPA